MRNFDSAILVVKTLRLLDFEDFDGVVLREHIRPISIDSVALVPVFIINYGNGVTTSSVTHNTCEAPIAHILFFYLYNRFSRKGGVRP